MTKCVRTSKALRTTGQEILWEPISDQQAEVAKGGFGLSTGGKLYKFFKDLFA
ncbi:MAG: hypothetical protein AAF821_03880 [Cyanobacteria bacterium P01_D01_bin.156]